MKKQLVYFGMLVAILLLAGNSQAALSYYTFSGQIDEIRDDAGIIEDVGLSIGDDVYYVFAIDYEETGTDTYNNGAIYTYNDNSFSDYFYNDFVSGSMINEKDGGYWNDPTHIAEYNHARYSLNGNLQTVAYGGSLDNWVRFEAFLGPITSWDIGDNLIGTEAARDSANNISWYGSSLTLTNISSVPIPGAVWLLGSGLIGLVGFRRKFKK